MLHCTVPVLFESSDSHAVLQDPVNKDWVALLGAINEERFGAVARRYYLALSHFRRQPARSALPGQLEIVAAGKQQAQQEMLGVWEQRKASRKLADGEQAADVLVSPYSSTASLRHVRGSPALGLLRRLRPPRETSPDWAACRASRARRSREVPWFKRLTLDAVGGQLYPWLRRPNTVSGHGVGTSMTDARSRQN
jgi:hypothetical protein